MRPESVPVIHPNQKVKREDVFLPTSFYQSKYTLLVLIRMNTILPHQFSASRFSLSSFLSVQYVSMTDDHLLLPVRSTPPLSPLPPGNHPSGPPRSVTPVVARQALK